MSERCFRFKEPTSPCGLLVVKLFLALSILAATLPSFRSSDTIPAAEFAGIIQDFSEPGGYFQSDNFVSNEDSYLSVVGKIQELGASGGAYIGVGPEQNFTYIARVRPQIAFIVDIRRQAMIQHLMYKAIFSLSPNRAEFLAKLLSRPLVGKDAPGGDASIDQLIQYFSVAPASTETFRNNLARIEATIRSDFKFPLSDSDHAALEYVYRAFHSEGVSISFRLNTNRGRYGRFSSMGELAVQLGPDGKPGNFLANEADYQFVRNFQQQNRIIPLVGDFAGEKTLKAVGNYLRKNSLAVSVFYISNVEQFLFQNDSFDSYAKNVKLIPITTKSIFIRSIPNFGRDSFSGIRMRTQLQNISTFLDDCDRGIYLDYWTLANTHAIPLSP
jgi:hypothetical protein